MNCFECAVTGTPEPAVAICQHCGAALCLDHLAAAERASVGGAHMGCTHDLSRAATPHPGLSVAAGTAR